MNECILAGETNAGSKDNWFNGKSLICIKPISELNDAADNKKILLPLFQRDKVWKEGRICCLWDSLLRGFPLPSFILSEGKVENDSRELASDNAKRASTAAFINGIYYDLIDGQQRLAAIQKGFKSDSSIRLWIDLDPPKVNHPLHFKFWIHPCTSTFPFGFKMESSDEYGFKNFSDSTIRGSIWPAIQKMDTNEIISEIFEVELTKSFPWDANCPVPLEKLLKIDQNLEIEKIKRSIVNIYTEENIQLSKIKENGFTKPDESTVDQLAKALEKFRSYEVAIQKTESDVSDCFTLFERIGRGGVQISQRQLGISRLMLEMGKPANEAVAKFQNEDWGDILDTEEIIHAISRISYANIDTPPPPPLKYDHDELTKITSWDHFFEINLTSIQKLQISQPENWKRLINEMLLNCEKLVISLDELFKSVLHINHSGNPNSFSLIQLAQTTREGGINPITLHPLLYWAFYIRKDGQIINADTQQNLLQWIIFANGIVHKPDHNKLNRLAFHQISSTQELDMQKIRKVVFSDFSKRDLDELGMNWKNPILSSSDDKIVDQDIEMKDIPGPDLIYERTIRRLFLRNWADDSGVNDFILMWNQRAMLNSIYGKTKPKHIHALYGKGRPVDADHIVARNNLMYMSISIDPKEFNEAILTLLPEKYRGIKIPFDEDTFRKRFTNLKGNYRYWPLYLNRSDQDCSVNEKLPKEKILAKLSGHPLFNCFNTQEDKDIGWTWSAIKNISDWESLPPKDRNWNQTEIIRLITAIMRRDYDLYASAYQFLLPTEGTLNLNNIRDIF